MELIGGKGVGLNALYSADFSVPKGNLLIPFIHKLLIHSLIPASAFCVTSAAFKRQMHQTNIGSALTNLVAELDAVPGVNEELNEVRASLLRGEGGKGC